MIKKLFYISSNKGMKLGLDRLKQLDAVFDYPSKSFLSIHVGGTNGKGSTSFKIARALQCAGRKVGLYTSPHISTVRERIQVNGANICAQDMEVLLEEIFSKSAQYGLEPTFFETMTLLSFLYFRQKQIDVAVVEVGLGGRLDATNIITPLLSIITSIGYDHTQYLGKSLEEISIEKGGIIKEGIPILLGYQASNQKILHRLAAIRKSPCYLVSKERSSYERHLDVSASGKAQIFDEICRKSGEDDSQGATFEPIYRQRSQKDEPFLRELTSNWCSYEEENRFCAKKALEILPFRTFSHEGILQTPPCRFEQVRKNGCDIILDVAHNPCAMISLLTRLDLHFSGQKCAFVVGFSADKDVETMLRLLMPKADCIYLTKASHARAYAPKCGEEFFRKNAFNNFVVEENIASSLEKAMKSHFRIVVCGTFYIMDKVREALGFQQERDDFIFSM